MHLWNIISLLFIFQTHHWLLVNNNPNIAKSVITEPGFTFKFKALQTILVCRTAPHAKENQRPSPCSEITQFPISTAIYMLLPPDLTSFLDLDACLLATWTKIVKIKIDILSVWTDFTWDIVQHCIFTYLVFLELAPCVAGPL